MLICGFAVGTHLGWESGVRDGRTLERERMGITHVEEK
ncbi:hypothetical protein HWB05_gp006 [Streptomyces phage BRock]|uniref:Uncharacterized protein n=1 Tax=Streptomyces phage BRock TaxID=1913591 RepID=A0A1J0GVR7_9CAUD|nr:hypothetical protein HWB05_gp006 [Streptomyces phage BRock]APC46268.1 hypothetical protein [Streptomyces phage BRock]